MRLVCLVVREAPDARSAGIRSAAFCRRQASHRADGEALHGHRQIHTRQLSIAVGYAPRRLAALIGTCRRHIGRRAEY